MIVSRAVFLLLFLKLVICNANHFKVGGRFKRVAQVGQVLHPGTLVARLEAQAGVEVTKPVDFEGTFEEWSQTRSTTSPINIHFSEILQVITAHSSCDFVNVISGFSDFEFCILHKILPIKW